MPSALQHHTPSLPFSDTSVRPHGPAKVFNLPGSVCPQGGPPNTLCTMKLLIHRDPPYLPLWVHSKSIPHQHHSACSITWAAAQPTLLHVPGFFLPHSLRRHNRPGNKGWCQSGVIFWQGIWEVTASVLNLSPPHPRGCTAILSSSSQPATRLCSCLLAAGGIAGKHRLREGCFLVPAAAPS